MATGSPRQKKTTVTSAVKTVQAVQSMHEPTSALTPAEMEHFTRCIQSREFETWAPHDLAVATNLAKLMTQFDEASDEVRENGRTEVNQRGTRVVSAEVATLLQLSGAIRATSQSLGLSASQKGLVSGSQRHRNQVEQSTRKLINKASKDSLLAGFDNDSLLA
jgi:hypothetical protein